MMLCLDSGAKTNGFPTWLSTHITCEQAHIPALAISGQASLNGPLINTCSTYLLEHTHTHTPTSSHNVKPSLNEMKFDKQINLLSYSSCHSLSCPLISVLRAELYIFSLKSRQNRLVLFSDCVCQKTTSSNEASFSFLLSTVLGYICILPIRSHHNIVTHPIPSVYLSPLINKSIIKLACHSNLLATIMQSLCMGFPYSSGIRGIRKGHKCLKVSAEGLQPQRGQWGWRNREPFKGFKRPKCVCDFKRPQRIHRLTNY